MVNKDKKTSTKDQNISGKWSNTKQALLKSGIALEYSVFQVLSKKVDLSGSFSFERNGATHSIDAVGRYITAKSDPLDVWFLMECKWKSKNSIWVFSPTINKTDNINSKNIVMDEIVSNKLFESGVYSDLPKSMVSSSRASDLNLDKEREDEIFRAINQLIFATVNLVVEKGINYQLSVQDPRFSKSFVFVPIIVTTAQLWVVRSKIVIEDIEKSDSQSKILKKVPSITLLLHSNGELINYFREKLLSQEDAFLEYYTRTFKLPLSDAKKTWLQFIDEITGTYPRRVFVVNYKYLDDEIDRFIKFFRDKIVDPSRTQKVKKVA